MMSRAIRAHRDASLSATTAPWSSSMKSIRPVLPRKSELCFRTLETSARPLFFLADATMSGWPITALIAANILSNGRDEIRLNRSTSTVDIIPTAFLAGLDERAEYLGPIFLESSVALESSFQHGSCTRFWASGQPSAAPNGEVKASSSRSDAGNETSLSEIFAATRARRSNEAIRRARASTKPSNSASGGDPVHNPYRSAVSPSKSLALRTVSSARPRPTRWGKALCASRRRDAARTPSSG